MTMDLYGHLIDQNFVVSRRETWGHLGDAHWR